MLILLPAVGWLVLAAAFGGAFYGILSLGALKAFLGQTGKIPAAHPPVTLLKPLHGAERGLRETLEDFCRQDYPAAVQLVFGVQSPTDPAIAIVGDLQAKYPGSDIVLAVGARDNGANPKIANLIHMITHARYEFLVLSDSDIRVPHDYLESVVGTLEQPGVGGVFCFYIGQRFGNIWSSLAAMGIDYQFLPNVMTAVRWNLAAPCLGSTIALRKSMLAEIGGFEAFRTVLADDYEIGRAIRALDRRLAFAPLLLQHNCLEESLPALLRHELRWARTIRGINGAGHAGSIVTHSVALSLIGALLLGFSIQALAALGIIVAARGLQKLLIDRMVGRKGSPLWLLPFRDLLSFAVFLGSYFGREVDWRGSRYRVNSGILARD